MQKSEIPVESRTHDRRSCMVHHNSVTSPLCHYTFSDTAHLIEVYHRHVLDQDRRPACLYWKTWTFALQPFLCPMPSKVNNGICIISILKPQVECNVLVRWRHCLVVVQQGIILWESSCSLRRNKDVSNRDLGDNKVFTTLVFIYHRLSGRLTPWIVHTLPCFRFKFIEPLHIRLDRQEFNIIVLHHFFELTGCPYPDISALLQHELQEFGPVQLHSVKVVSAFVHPIQQVRYAGNNI